MAAVSTSLGRYLRTSRCAYADVESDSNRFTIHRDYTDGCESTAGTYELTMFGQQAVELLRRGTTLVIHHVDEEMGNTPGAMTFRSIGIQAIICCALVKQGRLVAMMAVHQVEKRQWQAHEIALLEEVTERCWDTIERVRAQKIAVQHEQQFRDYFDFVPDAQLLIDPEGRIRLANRQFCELFNTSISTIAGLLAREVLPPAIVDRYLADIQPDSWLGDAANEPANDSVSTPIVIHGENGEKRYVEVSQNVITLPEGTLRALSLRDVSDRVELEEELRQSKKMETIGLLAGGIAHDFNNLLTVIISSAELALLNSQLQPELVKGVETIRNAGLQASQLTRQLLAFSRQQVLQPEVIDLNSKLREFEDLVRRLIGESIEVELLLERDLTPVNLDSTQLQQVVLNLAANARDAMPDGGKLTISTRKTDSLPVRFGSGKTGSIESCPYVILSISDTGQGIDDEDLESIFDPFYTTKAVGKGTGLGLSTVYGIVKQSNGHLLVESEPGRGAIFSMAFPASYELPNEVSNNESHAVHTRSRNILIVEDTPELAAATKQLLQLHGFTAESATSSEEALQFLRDQQHSVDLLITDVALADMPGPALAEEARRYRPNLQILYTSGEGLKTLGPQLVEDINHRFLAKPYAAEQLRSVVSELLTVTDQKPH